MTSGRFDTVTVRGLSLWLLIASLHSVGCAPASSDRAAPSPANTSRDSSEVSTIVLALTSVPSDVRCMRVMVTGSQKVVRSFDLNPATQASVALTGLPLGTATVYEETFNVPCASVTVETPATWVSIAPASVTLVSGAPVSLTVVLRRPGGLNITSDFQDNGGMVTLAPTSGAFPDTVVGGTGSSVSFTVTNGSSVMVSMSPVIGGAVPMEFVIDTSRTTCAGVLPIGGNCTIVVRFSPGSVGTKTAVLYTNMGGSSAALSGNGVRGGGIVLSPMSVDYGSLLVGTVQLRNFTLTNTSTAAIPVAPVVEGNLVDFAITPTSPCPTSLPAGASCTVPVMFRPTTSGGVGAKTARIAIGPGSTLFATITATSVVGSLTISPVSRDFGSVTVGATSASATFSVTNNTATNAGTWSMGLTGANPADFVRGSSTCAGLAPSASCTYSVAFSPQSLGLKSASVDIGPVAPMIALSGNGVTATGAPVPVVHLAFNENNGSTLNVTNGGSAGGTLARGALTLPAFSTNTPTVNGGPSSLDFGTLATATGVVESAAAIPALAGLARFTITGWLNNRSAIEGSGGNRVASWINNGAGGVDLVYRNDGSLQMSVDQWPDAAVNTPRSSVGKISTDAAAGAGNWRFFAVTYDMTSANVEYFFGTNTADAASDVVRNYPGRGVVDAATGPLAIGHFNSRTRSMATDRMFRGLIDDIRIFADVLTLEQIKTVQRGPAGGCSSSADCAARPHMVATCNAPSCAYTCEASFQDCDGVANNGCEVDVRVGTRVGDTVANCGGCGPVKTCGSLAGRHALASCNNGSCTAQCDAPTASVEWKNCDGVYASGCNVDVRSSGENCGGCGNVCRYTNASYCPNRHDSCGQGTCYGEFLDEGAGGVYFAPITLPSAVVTEATCEARGAYYQCTGGRYECDSVSANGCESTRDTGSCQTTYIFYRF